MRNEYFHTLDLEILKYLFPLFRIKPKSRMVFGVNGMLIIHKEQQEQIWMGSQIKYYLPLLLDRNQELNIKNSENISIIFNLLGV